jgi:hypothetical protein
LVLLPVEQASLDFAHEVVGVSEGRPSISTSLADEGIHAFRAAGIRGELLNKDQGVATNVDGVVEFLLRCGNPGTVQPAIAKPENTKIDGAPVDFSQVDV